MVVFWNIFNRLWQLFAIDQLPYYEFITAKSFRSCVIRADFSQVKTEIQGLYGKDPCIFPLVSQKRMNMKIDLFQHIWLILFVLWGIPLTFYRSKFRKIVYQTNSWLINVKPLFWKEIKALFTNMYPDNRAYLKFRNFYRFYLIVYFLLFIIYLLFK